MKIQFFYRKAQGTSFHRMVNPFSYYPQDENTKVEMLEHKTDEGHINCDVLVYSNFLSTSAEWLKELKKQGTKIIVDIDDIWQVSPAHPSYKMLEQNRFAQRTIENIQIADVVTCTSMRLQEQIRKYNKNTVVIPNAFPYGQENYTPDNRTTSDKTRFLYCGSVGHFRDVQLLAGKFQRIATDASIRDNSQFILAGYEKPKRIQYFSAEDQKAQNNNYRIIEGTNGQWDKMASVFNRTGCADIRPSRDLVEYIEHYDDADVSIVPLQDHNWNYGKSTLKFAEAATRNIPVMCSNVPPYSDVPETRGIIWIDKNDWIPAIKKCIKDRAYIEDMGIQLGEYCREHYELTKWNEVRKQVIDSLS